MEANSDGTGATMLLAGGTRCAWSPVANQFALRGTGNSGEIYLLNPGDVAATQLTTGAKAEHRLCWSKDGNYVIFDSRSLTGDLVIKRVDVATGTISIVSAPPGVDVFDPCE